MDSYLLAEIGMLKHQVADLQNRLNHVVRIGQTSLATNETTGTATVQIQHNPYETHSDINIAQQFGFASSPPIGSAVLALSLGGDQSRKIVVASHNNGLRPQGMPGGGSILYDASGTQVALENNGTVIVKVGGVNILTISATGIQVMGQITATGDVVGNNISLDNHYHTLSGSNTSTPIG